MAVLELQADHEELAGFIMLFGKSSDGFHDFLTVRAE